MKKYISMAFLLFAVAFVGSGLVSPELVPVAMADNCPGCVEITCYLNMGPSPSCPPGKILWREYEMRYINYPICGCCGDYTTSCQIPQ